MRSGRRWPARMLALLGIAAAAAGVATIAAGDRTVLSPDELRRSVTGEVDAYSHDEPCRRARGATWRCSVDGTGSNARIEYRVTMIGTRCWRAERVGGYGYGLPGRASGCVDLLDSLLGAF